MFKQILFRRIILSLFLLCLSLSIRAQQESSLPVPVEILVGQQAFYYQHVMNRKVHGDKWGFFNISSIDARYEDQSDYVFLISNLLTYQLGKGFAIGIGGEVQRPGTFAIVGAQYVYANPKTLLVIYPSVNLNGKTQYSHFSLLEYKPQMNETWSYYFRLQVLAVVDTEHYYRGYQQFRVGWGKGNVQWGLAANFDQFNDGAIRDDNYGLFLRMSLR